MNLNRLEKGVNKSPLNTMKELNGLLKGWRLEGDKPSRSAWMLSWKIRKEWMLSWKIWKNLKRQINTRPVRTTKHPAFAVFSVGSAGCFFLWKCFYILLF